MVKKNRMDEMIAEVGDVNIDDMPLENIDDYRAYNKRARELNKKAKKCIYPVKQCPLELHPKERVVFGRVDQPDNALPVYISNEMIEYKETLYPGKTYDLPRMVVEYLSKKGTPVWKWFDNPDGSKETRVSHMKPRFTLRTIYQD